MSGEYKRHDSETLRTESGFSPCGVMFDLYKNLENANIKVVYKNNCYYYNNYLYGVPPVVANYFGLSEDLILYINYLHTKGHDFDDIGCDLIQRFNIFSVYDTYKGGSYGWMDD